MSPKQNSYDVRHLGNKNIYQTYLRIGSDTVQLVRCMPNLGTCIDRDLSMRSHVSKTVSNCLTALHRLRSIRRHFSMMRLDYGSATLAGLPGHMLDHLQSLLNVVAHLICYMQKYDHITHLQDLHWLRVQKKYNFHCPYSLSAAVTTCSLQTSSAIFSGLMRSRCNDYGLALNSA